MIIKQLTRHWWQLIHQPRLTTVPGEERNLITSTVCTEKRQWAQEIIDQGFSWWSCGWRWWNWDSISSIDNKAVTFCQRLLDHSQWVRLHDGMARPVSMEKLPVPVLFRFTTSLWEMWIWWILSLGCADARFDQGNGFCEYSLICWKWSCMVAVLTPFSIYVVTKISKPASVQVMCCRSPV